MTPWRWTTRRRRCVATTRFSIVSSFLFWFGSCPVLLLWGFTQLGAILSTSAVIVAIFAIGINVGGNGYANTLKILRAIESLQQERPR